MTDVGSQGIRGKRKSTYMAGAVVLVIVAIMLSIAAYATGTSALFFVAVALAAIAILLVAIGQRVRKTPPSHEDHPRLTHDEDHPKDKETP